MLPDISIVIAAYNEEERIPASLEKIGGYLAARQHRAEVIVVDDGSKDKTAERVLDFQDAIPGLHLVRYTTNRGKGYALRTGVLMSRGRLVLLSDADCSTPIEELEKLRPLIIEEAHHVAIGSRALPDSDIVLAQPPWRRGMGRLFNTLVRMVVLEGFQDTQCGFKLFSGDAARSLFQAARIDRFAYDVEILALAKRHGYRVAEVPIEWTDRAGSKVRPLLDSLQMLADLARIRWTTLSTGELER